MESLIGAEAAEQVRARLREPAPEPPLLHGEQLRLRRLLFYYEALNEDREGTGFPGALQGLADDFGPRLSTRGDPPEDAVKAITDFATRWRLPHRHGAGDVLASLRWPPEWGPLRLRFGSRGYTGPTIGTPVAYLAEADGELLPVREHLPIIFPWVPLPFDYDPRVCPLPRLRQHAKELARAMVDNIMEQGEALEREARQQGWAAIGSRHRGVPEVRRMALRLYRAAVCQLDWEEIADREMAEDPDAEPDAQSVRLTAQEWARELGVELPERRVGRPRKT